MLLDLAVLHTPAEVERLLPEWNALAALDDDGAPFRRGDVTCGLWQVFAPALKPRVAIARDAAGRLIGVLPLARDHRRVGPMRLRILGPLARWHGAEFDVTLHPEAPPETIARLIEELRTDDPQHDAIVVQHISADARIIQAIQTRPESVSRRVRLGPTGPTPLGRTAKNLRRTTRRTRETFPDLQLVHGVPATEVREWLVRFVALHRLRWSETPTPSPFDRARVGDRFVNWFAGLVETGLGELHVMRTGNDLLGGLCVLRGRHGTFGWRVAVTRSHTALGLGIQLCQAVMEHCGARGDRWYDIGHGEERYKGLWEAEVLPLYRWRSPGPGWRWPALKTLGTLTRRPWVQHFLHRPPESDLGTTPATSKG
jgi:CelD/BcsL family acetyltransferase involved in cellulose biosynthesis